MNQRPALEAGPPSRLEADGLRVTGTDLVLGEPWCEAARGRGDGLGLEIGVRPEFVRLAAATDAGTAPASVVRVEDLGNYKLVTARLGPHELRAKLDEDAPVPSGEVRLAFVPARTLLYADGRLVG